VAANNEQKSYWIAAGGGQYRTGLWQNVYRQTQALLCLMPVCLMPGCISRLQAEASQLSASTMAGTDDIKHCAAGSGGFVVEFADS